MIITGTPPNGATEPLDVILVNAFAAATAGTVTQNRAHLCAFRVSRTLTVNQISIPNQTTVSGNVDVGVYRKDSATDWTRLASNGGTAMSGSGVAQTLGFSDVTLVPGYDYALAFASDSATATFHRFSLSGVFTTIGLTLGKEASYPLPATITSPTRVAQWPVLQASHS